MSAKEIWRGAQPFLLTVEIHNGEIPLKEKEEWTFISFVKKGSKKARLEKLLPAPAPRRSEVARGEKTGGGGRTALRRTDISNRSQ